MTKLKNIPDEEVPVATTTPIPASTSDIKQDWVDNTEDSEVNKSTVQVAEEQDFAGALSNPEVVEERDTLEHAQDLGLHETDEEHPDEVGVAEDVNSTEARQKPS